MATKNRALDRIKELENRIKELQSLINKSKLGSAVNEEEREFILAKLSKDYRDSKNKIQLSMVKPADNIQDRIIQLQQEVAKVEKHLGTRYLTKASEVPTGYSWSFKPEPGNPNRMINPDYIRSFDIDVQKGMQPKEGSDAYIIANPQEYTSAMVRQAQRNLTGDVEVSTPDTEVSTSDTPADDNKDSLRAQQPNPETPNQDFKTANQETPKGTIEGRATLPEVARWTGRGSGETLDQADTCLLYTSPSPRDS